MRETVIDINCCMARNCDGQLTSSGVQSLTFDQHRAGVAGSGISPWQSHSAEA